MQFTPFDLVRFTSAYAVFLKESRANDKLKIVIGRDARKSGKMVRDIVVSTLTGMGFDVIDLGLSTTPTVEMAVVDHGADGGIILTASHNPAEWNALKLLDHNGEFLDARAGAEILKISDNAYSNYLLN